MNLKKNMGELFHDLIILWNFKKLAKKYIVV